MSRTGFLHWGKEETMANEVEQLLNQWTEFRDQQTRRDTEIAAWGAATQETKNQLTQMLTDFQERADAVDEQFRGIQARMNRPDFGGSKGRTDDQVRQIYAKWDTIRTGKRVDPSQVDVEAIQKYSQAFRAYLYG